MVIVDWYPESHQSAWTSTVPLPWTFGPISATLNTPLASSHNETRYLRTRVWISCTDLPAGISPDVLNYSASVEGDELKLAGLTPKSDAMTSGDLPEQTALTCGAGGSAGKSSNPSSSIGEGENFSWSISAIPPNGVVEVSDAVVIDRVHPKTVFVSASSGSPAEFQRWYCVVPSELGNFGRAAFLSTYQASNCSTTVPATPETVTHVVWHAPVWGDPAVGITNFSGSLTVHAPLAVFDHDELVVNEALISGEFSQPAVGSFTYTPTANIRIKTLAQWVGSISQYPNSQNSIARRRGDEFVIHFAGDSSHRWKRVRNPTVDIELPPELEFVAPEGIDFNGGPLNCTWDGPEPTVYSQIPAIEPQADGRTLVRYWFGDSQDPVRLPLDCIQGSGFALQRTLWVSVRVRVRYGAEVVNGQLVTVRALVDGENLAPGGWTSFSRDVPIALPPEMRTTVEPDCTDDTDPEPSLFVTYENSGGETLNDVWVSVTLPKTGDGSGTQVDTNFVRFENLPSGTSVQYTTDLTEPYTWTTTQPALSSITAVRVLLDAPLLPFTGPQAFNVVLSVPAGTPEGTFIRGSSRMNSAELNELASAVSAPIRVNLCPGILSAHGFFDANDNELPDPGEQDLAGWTVVVTWLDDPTVQLTWTLDADGQFSQQVPTGEYSLALIPPTGTPGDWPTVIRFGTVFTNDTTHVLLPINCTCEQPEDLCTEAVCLPSGFCVEETIPGCDLNNFECINGQTQTYDCGEAYCFVEGQQICVDGFWVEDCAFEPEPVPCGQNACASGTGQTYCFDGQILDTCDEVWGNISSLPHDDDICADTNTNTGLSVVYLVVQGPDGQDAGSVRCWQDIASGQVDCETIAGSDTILRVYPDLLCFPPNSTGGN